MAEDDEDTFSSAATSLESLVLPCPDQLPTRPKLTRPAYLAHAHSDTPRGFHECRSSDDIVGLWASSYQIMDEDEEEEDMVEEQASQAKSSLGTWVEKITLGHLNPFHKTTPKIVQVERTDHFERRISASIIGYEILQHQEKYVMFKIKVDDLGEWSVDRIPIWHIFRRYSDMLTLFQRLRSEFPILALDFPPRKWLGNQFDPQFLGRRIQRLQTFLSKILEDQEVRLHPSVQRFFCFDAPPNQNHVNIAFERSFFDTLEETVHELREQLRAREILEAATHDLREMLKERDLEMDVTRQEVESLRRQKDSLLKALGDDSNVLSLPVPSLGRRSLSGSRMSLASHNSHMPHRSSDYNHD